MIRDSRPWRTIRATGVAAALAVVLTSAAPVPAASPKASPPAGGVVVPTAVQPTPSGGAADPIPVGQKQGQSVVPNFVGDGSKKAFAGTKHWLWTAPSTGRFRFTTYGSEVDTVLTVKPHGGGGPAVTNDDDGDVTTSTLVVNATAGQDLDLAVASKRSETGLLTLSWSAVTAAAAPATTSVASPADLGVTSSVYATIPVSANTGEKPQNKLWYYDGTWWAVVPSATILPAGSWVFRQEAGGWRNVLWLTGDTSVRADVDPEGDVVHILLHGATPQLISISYDAVNHTYMSWAPQPAPVTLSLPGSETATLAMDGTGRMWVAYDGSTSANVLWADYPYTTFSGPIVLANNIVNDDIDVVTQMPGAVGVMWSNQNTERFGFRMHVDGDPATTWSADEVPGNSSAVRIGGGMADDHINTAVAADGTFYAAVKTSYDTQGYPVLGLLVRRPNGSWDPFYPIDYVGTRPTLLLNEQLGLLTVAYTQSDILNNILVKSTPTSRIDFTGSSSVLIAGKNNNVTSTRQNWTGSVVFMASNGSTDVSTTFPSAPSASGGSSQVVVGSSVSGTLTGSTGLGIGQVAYNLVSSPTLGTVTVTDPATGAFTYTAGSQTGTDTFTYNITQGTLTSNTATWTVTVNPPPTPPSANGGSSQVVVGSSVSGTLTGTAGTGPSPLTYNLVSAPTLGTVTVTDPSTGAFTYTAGSQSGTDTFTYNITQGTLTSNTATWTVTVNATASPPSATGGSSQVVAGSSVSGTLTGTAGTGTTPLAYNLVSSPTLGTVTVTNPATGAFTYTAGSQSGTDTFTYNITQGTLTSNTATWTVTITPSATSGPVGAWNLDDGSGTTAIDSSGWGNNATLSGAPAWITGLHAGALSFEGTDDYGTVPDTNSLDATTALTIAVWARPAKVATQYLVKKAVQYTTDGYELGLSSTGKAFVRLNGSKSDTYRVNSVTSYPTNGTWIHLTATYDGTTLRLYVNGIQEGSVAGPTAIKTNTVPLTIGAEPGGTKLFTGALDDIRLYTTALTPAQITTLATP